MELKKLKDGEVAVTVIYHITEELVNKKFKFIRSVSRSKATDGIPAIYIDDQGRKKPTQSISFAEAGEHIVRIVLEDSTVVPFEILEEAENIYSVEIPESVTTVEIYAFRRAQIACPPVLPPNLKKIEKSAFEGAYKDVETIQLSDSVEFVGHGAFGFGKHLVVGKNYRGGVFNNITIPAENIYLEVRDGFIINRETRRVEAMLPGAFEDTASTTISLPEGITEFDDEYMFDDFHKASIYVPASVEKCRMNLSSQECEPAARTIEFAEGIGEISIICRVDDDEVYRDSKPGLEFKFPKNATLSLDLEAEHVYIPEGCRLKWCRGSIDRLELGPDVVLINHFSMGAFRDFEGEIFVKGPISFEHWGAMKEGSVIHVPDEETGRKILESPGFYKKIAIYVGDDRPLEAQQEGMADKRLFEILGCPDYDKVLKPVEPGWGGRMPTVVTLLYNLPAKTTVQINAYCGEYMLDDGDVKKLKKGKISIPKGQHIVRLIDLERIDHEPNNPWDKPWAPVFEPACDAMFIDNDINLHRISKHMKGVRHLILGNGCHVSELLLPVERVSVLAGNPCLEEKEGCIVHSETGELIFASIDCTGLPSGIKKIQDCALRNYSQERLVIPGSIKNAYLCNRTADFKDKIKEIVFEEGVERVELNNIEMCPEMKVSFPSSMKRLWMPEVTVSSMTVPHDIELTCCSNANIANLVFLGNVALRPGNFDGEVFEDFSGNIRFGGTVNPAIKTVSGEDAPATFFGTTSDNCTITVAHKETADVISACRDFNPNVKITVE
jgi:hypothetical protein